MPKAEVLNKSSVELSHKLFKCYLQQNEYGPFMVLHIGDKRTPQLTKSLPIPAEEEDFKRLISCMKKCFYRYKSKRIQKERLKKE